MVDEWLNTVRYGGDRGHYRGHCSVQTMDWSNVMYRGNSMYCVVGGGDGVNCVVDRGDSMNCVMDRGDSMMKGSDSMHCMMDRSHGMYCVMGWNDGVGNGMDSMVEGSHSMRVSHWRWCWVSWVDGMVRCGVDWHGDRFAVLVKLGLG